MIESPTAGGEPGIMPRRAGVDPLKALAGGVLIVVVLYFGREIFMPIALAVLLSFALAPLVRLLRRCHVPRGAAVAIAVLAAAALVGLLAWVVAVEVTSLAADLPRYQEAIRVKLAGVREALAGSGVMERAGAVIDRLSAELARPAPSAVPSAPADSQALAVVVREPPPGPFETVGAVLLPLIHPLATTGIVVIFVIFILLQREDLRNRFIKLVGTGDLRKTTEALDDAAWRLGRLLLTQLGINTAFGVVVSIGLLVIGVPAAALWGMLAGVLRFVPYIGAVLGAAMPLAIAAAVDPGWGLFLRVALLFLIIEPIVGHFLEPMVFGRSTGLSPVAVVVAATFWTWLWGPIGLLLATPMTVCLVVLGRHVKGLRFLEVLLGDRPALTPAELFYQRLLAGDADEVATVAEQVLKERSLTDYYDAIALPGLRLAQADAERGLLDRERLVRIRDTVEEVVVDLEGYADAAPRSATPPDGPEAQAALEAAPDLADVPVLAPDELPLAWRSGQPVLCIPGDSPLDEAAAFVLAGLLQKHGISAHAETSDVLSARRIFELSGRRPALACLCGFGGSPGQRRHAARRIRRRVPGVRIVLGDFGAGAEADVAEIRAATEADVAATTFKAAVIAVHAIASAERARESENAAAGGDVSPRPAAAPPPEPSLHLGAA